jgi:hypothetical protein
MKNYWGAKAPPAPRSLQNIACLHPGARKTSEIDSKGQITSAASGYMHLATGTPYSPILAHDTHVRDYSPYSNEIFDIKALEYKEILTFGNEIQNVWPSGE